VAEGAYKGGASVLAEDLEAKSGIESRACILGYIQRGGSPSVLDRILATKLGAFAVERVLDNATGVMVGSVDKNLVSTPLEQTWSNKKQLDDYLIRIHAMLSE
jgi:6-phosphofructokinase 1